MNPIEVVSPDGGIKARFHYPDGVTMAFRGDQYYRYDPANLCRQLERLCTLGTVEYTRLSGGVPRGNQQWNADTRRYRSALDELVVEAMSPGGFVMVQSTGMRSWLVDLADGTLEQLDDAAFTAEFISAMEQWLVQRRSQVIELKHAHYGLDLPQLLRQPPPPVRR